VDQSSITNVFVCDPQADMGWHIPFDPKTTVEASFLRNGLMYSEPILPALHIIMEEIRPERPQPAGCECADSLCLPPYLTRAPEEPE